jgi:hypothetical protein
MAKKQKRKSPRTKEQMRIARKVQAATYKRRAKKLRGTRAFGELFDAKSGVDFRKHPSKWPADARRRITKYAKELGPIIAGDSVTKRFYRPDHIEIAIESSPQRRRLPGQKAAIFPVDKGQTLEFSIDRKHRPTLKRGGIKETKTLFDMKALAKDADAEIDRVLAMTDANVFKIVTGESESSQGFTRSALKRTLKRWVVKYKKDDPDKDIAKFDKWMYGIKEYPTLKVTKRLATRTAKHEAEVAQRERERLRELAATKRAMTKAEQKSTRLTGRKGRTK